MILSKKKNLVASNFLPTKNVYEQKNSLSQPPQPPPELKRERDLFILTNVQNNMNNNLFRK